MVCCWRRRKPTRPGSKPAHSALRHRARCRIEQRVTAPHPISRTQPAWRVAAPQRPLLVESGCLSPSRGSRNARQQKFSRMGRLSNRGRHQFGAWMPEYVSSTARASNQMSDNDILPDMKPGTLVEFRRVPTGINTAPLCGTPRRDLFMHDKCHCRRNMGPRFRPTARGTPDFGAILRAGYVESPVATQCPRVESRGGSMSLRAA